MTRGLIKIYLEKNKTSSATPKNSTLFIFFCRLFLSCIIIAAGERKSKVVKYEITSNCADHKEINAAFAALPAGTLDNK